MFTEILAPAGGSEQLTAAVRTGADAVYLGVGNFNARRNAENFAGGLEQAVRYCHGRGVRCHVTLNTLVMDSELPSLRDELLHVAACAPDALIIQDLGRGQAGPGFGSGFAPPCLYADDHPRCERREAGKGPGFFPGGLGPGSWSSGRLRPSPRQWTWRSRALSTARCACPCPAAAISVPCWEGGAGTEGSVPNPAAWTFMMRSGPLPFL